MFPGSISSGNQVATLVVGSTLTQNDASYTCKVVSSTYPASAEAQVVAQLNVFGKFEIFLELTV